MVDTEIPMDIGGIKMEKSFKVFRWFWEDPVDKDLELDDKGKKKEVKKEEPKYTKADIDKAAARRQAALARARKAEEREKALEKQLSEMPDPDEFVGLQSQYAEMKKQLNELKEAKADADLQQIEDEKERARVKMEREFEKERKELKRKMDAMNQQVDSFQAEKQQHLETLQKFRQSSLENEIISIAAPKAFNPRQIVKLIVDDFEFDETDDKWYKNVYDVKGKISAVLSVDEYVTTFLTDKDNENLLKADIKRGSDTPRGNQLDRQDDGPPADQTPTDQMYKWAEMSGLDVNVKSTAEDKTWLYNTYTRLHSKQQKQPS
jgi:hypothetical protein